MQTTIDEHPIGVADVLTYLSVPLGCDDRAYPERKVTSDPVLEFVTRQVINQRHQQVVPSSDERCDVRAGVEPLNIDGSITLDTNSVQSSRAELSWEIDRGRVEQPRVVLIDVRYRTRGECDSHLRLFLLVDWLIADNMNCREVTFGVLLGIYDPGFFGVQAWESVSDQGFR